MTVQNLELIILNFDFLCPGRIISRILSQTLIIANECDHLSKRRFYYLHQIRFTQIYVAIEVRGLLHHVFTLTLHHVGCRAVYFLWHWLGVLNLTKRKIKRS